MFVKCDNSFVCKHCGKEVPQLKYTSRDHCNSCLYSLHVDITPGDRQNSCKGLLKPIAVIQNGKKEQIEYVCLSCGQKVRNIIAQDDDKEEIFNIVRNYAQNGGK